MIAEIVAVGSTVLGFMHFLGFSVHTRWFRIFAFPFRPPTDLVFGSRKKFFLAFLSFGGAACFWTFIAGLTLTLLISFYDRQWYGIDIPILILTGVFVILAFIAISTALYLLVRTVFWRQRPFIELHGKRYEPTQIYQSAALHVHRTWRLEPWKPGYVFVKSDGAAPFVKAGIGPVYDPTQVERIGQYGFDYGYCTLCHWLLCRADDEHHGQGYTDGEIWLCRECYERFIQPMQMHGGARIRGDNQQ